MPDVRFGSLADMCGAKGHVRFTPESDTFRVFSFVLERLLPMTTDEDAEILVLMREAMKKSRGYAPYWEWKPDKRRRELQAAKLLARFLWPGQDYSISSVNQRSTRCPMEDSPPSFSRSIQG